MGHNYTKLCAIVLQFHVKTKRKMTLLQLQNVAFLMPTVHLCAKQ